MTRIKILFLCAILTNFLQLYKALPQQQPDLYTLDGFIRQIRQLERTPTNANDFVKQAEFALHSTGKILTVIDWAYETNITDSNRKQKLGFKKNYDDFVLRMGKSAGTYDLNTISDEDVKRKIIKLKSQIGTNILEGDDLNKFKKLVNQMVTIYSTAKVPKFNSNKKVSMNSLMTSRMAQSRNPEELKHYWTKHRETTGSKMRDLFKEYLELNNKAAKLNGLTSGTEMKVQPYESDTFVSEMENTWNNLKPLYDQLHAYVRHRLHNHYSCEVVEKNGPIPAHVLGNMWAQSWGNIVDLVKPYPKKPSIDVTAEMKKQGWTVNTMFKKAEDFFVSMGLDPMMENFWKNGVFEKPTDREIICSASAWDLYTGDDFRIKMCAKVSQKDFVTVTHEMGHIQYFMKYKDQTYLFRDGANPGFHEAMADIAALAVGTPNYFKQIGLLDPSININDEETNINMLFDLALDRLAFLPFGYLVDKYRWDLMSGKVSYDDMNCHWHKLRSEIQGIVPPNIRYEDEFDAGAKYHVAADVPYVKYFTSYVYNFQFYKALCLASGQYEPNNPSKPLHRCNFYGNKNAGNQLVSMLKLGSSKPWKEAMKAITGKAEMSTDAFREYFKPLETWLQKENTKNNVIVGWENPPLNTICKKVRPN